MVRVPRQFRALYWSDNQYRFRRKRYVAGSSDIRMLRVLTAIRDARPQSADRFWLVRQRELIRQAQALGRKRIISWVIETTKDPALRTLAIWLRGRWGGTLGIKSVAAFAKHRDEQTRKEVARALRRLGAWVELREMAESDLSERVRRMATPRLARPFEGRLTDFTRHVAARPVTPHELPLFVSPEVDLSQGKRPKPGWFIRLILERIHRLVWKHSP
jgi:hypothetical protein